MSEMSRLAPCAMDQTYFALNEALAVKLANRSMRTRSMTLLTDPGDTRRDSKRRRVVITSKFVVAVVREKVKQLQVELLQPGIHHPASDQPHELAS